MSLPKKTTNLIIIISIVIVCGGVLFGFLHKKKSLEPSVTAPLKVEKKDSIVTVTLLSDFFDLEDFNGSCSSKEKAASGKHSCKLSKDIEYGFGVIKPVKSIPSYANLKGIDIDIKCWTKNRLSTSTYVLSIDDTTGKNILWEGQPINCETGKWCNLHYTFELKPAAIRPEYIIKLYAWNKGKKEEFFIDDVSVHYNGIATINANLTENSNTNFFFDFETTQGMVGTDNIQPTTAHSGKMACSLNGGIEYGPSVIKKVSDVSSVPLKKLSMSIWIYPLADDPNTMLTASIINSKKETVFWGGKGTEKQSFPKNKWTKVNALYVLPSEKISLDDVIQVNVWNKGKTDVIVDDLEIIYGEQSERRGILSSIDPNMFYEKHFMPQKNKPPFPVIYFEKQEINNQNSTFITADKKNDLADFSPNDEFLTGNFVADKNNLDDIICIKKGKEGLFSYSPENKQFQQIWSNINTTDSIWNENNKAYSGDFNTDGKWDILMINKKNSDWKIIDFEGKNWKVVLKGNEKNLNAKWLEKNKILPSVKDEIFKPSDILFSGNYFRDTKEQLLKLNLDWRFDLKLIEQNNGDATILGNVDFKGYPNDHNPKYYEFIKIISGKFIDPARSSLLIMMRNCADPDFKGIHCGQFEDVPYLPNSTQLYNLGNK